VDLILDTVRERFVAWILRRRAVRVLACLALAWCAFSPTGQQQFERTFTAAMVELQRHYADRLEEFLTLPNAEKPTERRSDRRRRPAGQR
jgi:hypothetical protein